MLPFRLIGLSVFLMSAIACGSSSSTSPSPTPTPGGSSVTIPAGASNLGNQAYSPDSVNVSVGGTVTWMNNDSTAHTSTSDASGWDSGVVAPGASFSRTFPTAGTFSYHCTLHTGMVGKVVVQ